MGKSSKDFASSEKSSDSEPAISLDLHHPDVQPAAQQLAKAFELSADIHLLDGRKISCSSYLSHVTTAAGLTLKAKGSVRATLITILHDVVEEGGGVALQRLHQEFSPSIVSAVMQMTPPESDKRLSWAKRKEQALLRMRLTDDRDVAMAFAADKAATLMELDLDCEQFGTLNVLCKLRGGCDELLWYYQGCWHALVSRLTPRMNHLLRLQVDRLRSRINHFSD